MILNRLYPPIYSCLHLFPAFSWITWLLNMGPMCCSETSANIYQPRPWNIQNERTPRLHHTRCVNFFFTIRIYFSEILILLDILDGITTSCFQDISTPVFCAQSPSRLSDMSSTPPPFRIRGFNHSRWSRQIKNFLIVPYSTLLISLSCGQTLSWALHVQLRHCPEHFMFRYVTVKSTSCSGTSK
jgi:hypothetical protein